jgi:hypothetical protein
METSVDWKSFVTRRKFLGGGAAVVVGGLCLLRTSGYRQDLSWTGTILAPWEAEVVAKAAAAVLPDEPEGDDLSFAEAWEVVARVDQYLVGTPVHLQQQIHMLIRFLEHGTILAGALTRFSAMTPRDAHGFLLHLRDRGGPARRVYRATRDFVYLGWYQSPATWKALKYPGPRAADSHSRAGVRILSKYDHLLAKQGATPKGTC